MNQRDLNRQRSGELLAYWKDRLKDAEIKNEQKAYYIKIVPDTLAWFIEMIESRCTIVMPKKPWWKFWDDGGKA